MADVSQTAKDLEGDHDRGPLGILLPSGSSFLSAFLAAVLLDRPACTLHPDWADPELEAAIADAGLSLVISDRPDLPGQAMAEPSDRQFPESNGDDPVFYIGFTSGTSGRPKPFFRRQKSWSSSFAPAGEMFSIEAGDVVYLPGSLQHSHFLFGALLAFNRGAAVRLFERFDAAKLALELHEASRGVVYLVPTMLVSLDEVVDGPLEGVHSVVISGAKMESHHWEIARRLFPNALVGELYGASETSFMTVNTEGEIPSKPGYVGRAFPGVELEIRDEGLVHVRSPYLFDGYLEGPETHSPVGADGFMTVGDIGVLDGEGLSLVGRASNMLITGGKNVHPEEIEAQLVDHPAVKDCVVVGVPHPRWGEEIVAFVVPADPDARPDSDDLGDHLRERIASYKIPKRWFTVPEIPRTLAGKTDRSRDRLLERGTEL